MRCRRSDRQRQSGAALVVAMLVFAVCAALVVAMRGEFQRFYQRNANLLQAEQAHAYLRGAEDLAAMVLLQDRDQDKNSDRPRDDLTEIWAIPADQRPPYSFEQGWMIGELEDLQGRFNLNLLTHGEPDDTGSSKPTPHQKQFIRLLQALPDLQLSEYEARLVTRAIGDWLDADRQPHPDGAEDDFYGARSPAHRTANRPMASVSELRAVANVTPELYLALLPWITVLPETADRLNIHTAPAMLLRSINGNDSLLPLDETEAQSLVQYREESGFTDIDDFLSQPAFQDKGDMNEIRPLLGERSDYFLMSAEARLADRNMRLYSVLERKNRQVTSLARASGSL